MIDGVELSYVEVVYAYAKDLFFCLYSFSYLVKENCAHAFLALIGLDRDF